MYLLDSNDFVIFEKIIKSSKFLIDYDYSCTSYQKEYTRFGCDYIIKWFNNESETLITINFSKDDSFIFIERSGKRHDVGSFVKNQLGFDNYFDNYEELDIQDFINMSLMNFEKIAKNELSKLIRGLEWIETPIDWQGHK